MNIYQIGYTQNVVPYGNMHTTKFVKANNEKEAIEIASKLLNIPRKDISVIFKVECIN